MADQIHKTGAAVRVKGSKMSTKADEPGEVGEIIDLVKTYVRQETIGPLKGLGRKVGIGVVGSVLIGLGLFFLALGLLRLIQDKIPRLAHGGLSWVSYLIVVAFCGVVTVVALSRIKKIKKELN